MSYEQLDGGLFMPRDFHTPYRSTDRYNRSVEAWNPSSDEIDDCLLSSLDDLRNQCRDLDRNESVARGSVDNIVGNVVGEGLWPQAKLNHEMLEISSKEAREFENKAETIFRTVAESKSIDFLGQSNFTQMLDIALRSCLIDGDILAVRREQRGRGLHLMNTCLQLIPGSRVADPGEIKEGADIRQGVETDSYGRPIAYYIRNRKKNSGFDSWTNEFKRVPAWSKEEKLQVLHMYRQRLPDQTRGEPLLAPTIEKFHQLSKYSKAEISAAVINSFFTTFVTSEGISPISQGDRDTAFRTTQKNDIPQEWRRRKIGPMSIVNLLPGERVESPTPGRPSPQFDPFFQAVLKQIGPAIGLPYEVLTQHFSSSYSAARAALLQAWQFFKVRRKWLEIDFCQPVYEWIVEEAIYRGILKAPGFEDPFKRALYLKAQWIGQEMPSIDRLKDAKADTEQIKNGTMSRRRIVESKGLDYDKICQELQSEKETLRHTKII